MASVDMNPLIWIIVRTRTYTFATRRAASLQSGHRRSRDRLSGPGAELLEARCNFRLDEVGSHELLAQGPLALCEGASRPRPRVDSCTREQTTRGIAVQPDKSRIRVDSASATAPPVFDARLTFSEPPLGDPGPK